MACHLCLRLWPVTCIWGYGLSPVSETMACHLWLWPVTCVWDCGLSPVSEAMACHLWLWPVTCVWDCGLSPVSEAVACHLCLRLWPVTCVWRSLHSCYWPLGRVRNGIHPWLVHSPRLPPSPPPPRPPPPSPTHTFLVAEWLCLASLLPWPQALDLLWRWLSWTELTRL